MAINDDTPHDDAYWRHSHWSWWPMSTRSLRKRIWILKTNWPWLRLCSFLSGMLWNSGIVSRYQFEINAVLELRRDAFALNPICETCEISLKEGLLKKWATRSSQILGRLISVWTGLSLDSWDFQYYTGKTETSSTIWTVFTILTSALSIYRWAQ